MEHIGGTDPYSSPPDLSEDNLGISKFHLQDPPHRQATMPDIGTVTVHIARRTTCYHLTKFGARIDIPYLKYVCVIYSQFLTCDVSSDEDGKKSF